MSRSPEPPRGAALESVEVSPQPTIQERPHARPAASLSHGQRLNAQTMMPKANTTCLRQHLARMCKYHGPISPFLVPNG